VADCYVVLRMNGRGDADGRAMKSAYRTMRWTPIDGRWGRMLREGHDAIMNEGGATARWEKKRWG